MYCGAKAMPQNEVACEIEALLQPPDLEGNILAVSNRYRVVDSWGISRRLLGYKSLSNGV